MRWPWAREALQLSQILRRGDANKEQAHPDRIAQRIVQLGGEPDFSPEGLLSRSHSEYVEGDKLVNMVKEDLVAERVAIDSYREMVEYFKGCRLHLARSQL